MIWITIIILVLVFIIWFLYNPTTRRIRAIQSLLNKDRSISDVINSINGWKIDNTSVNGVRILINPIVMPIYPLYITYNQRRPTNTEIKELHYKLTNSNSIVTKAHKMGMPVETYLSQIGH